MMRPGRADQHVDTAFDRAALLLVVGAAKGEADLEAGVLAEQTSASFAICTASSRVGASMKQPWAALVLSGVTAAGSSAGFWKAAIRKAAVLPVPVCACPATSCPLSAIGRVLAWIGVQNSKPASRMPAWTRRFVQASSAVKSEVAQMVFSH